MFKAGIITWWGINYIWSVPFLSRTHLNKSELFYCRIRGRISMTHPHSRCEKMSPWAIVRSLCTYVHVLCHHLQVHQEVIQHCDARTGISLFIQVAMCLSNITCCLDALCYYFIAHEVRSSKDTFRLSVMIQRRATFSTSEVWTWDEDGWNILCSLEEWSGLWAEHVNGKRAECWFQYEATRWKVRVGKETGQRWV